MSASPPNPARRRADGAVEAVEFTCPACGRSTRHRDDVVNRHCSRCHWWTGLPELAWCRSDLFSRYGRPVPLPCPWGSDVSRSSAMTTVDWTKPIHEGNLPEGARVHEVPHGNSTLPIIGRLVAEKQPCAVDGGCGRGTATVLRCPTSGLNLPGEPSSVAVVTVCGWGCRLTSELVDADEQERGWGWDHDNVV